MDDAACREFFTRPSQTYHRRYEALRAVFVEGRPQQEVADALGFTYGSMRQLVYAFRQKCLAGEQAAASPFFETSPADAPIPARKPPDGRHRR